METESDIIFVGCVAIWLTNDQYIDTYMVNLKPSYKSPHFPGKVQQCAKVCSANKTVAIARYSYIVTSVNFMLHLSYT